MTTHEGFAELVIVEHRFNNDKENKAVICQTLGYIGKCFSCVLIQMRFFLKPNLIFHQCMSLSFEKRQLECHTRKKAVWSQNI